MDRTFNKGYKQYTRTTPKELFEWLKIERKLVGEAALGDFDDLTKFDLRDEVCFLIHLDSRPVGFVSVRFLPEGGRRLMKIYVTPRARRHGCASVTIRGLKISKASIPVRHVSLLGICRRIGFTYSAKQDHPQSVAELERKPENKTYVQRRAIQVAQLG